MLLSSIFKDSCRTFSSLLTSMSLMMAFSDYFGSKLV